MSEFEVKKIYKGGVLIPKSIREKLGLFDGEFIKITVLENGKIELEKIEIKH